MTRSLQFGPKRTSRHVHSCATLGGTADATEAIVPNSTRGLNKTVHGGRSYRGTHERISPRVSCHRQTKNAMTASPRICEPTSAYQIQSFATGLEPKSIIVFRRSAV